MFYCNGAGLLMRSEIRITDSPELDDKSSLLKTTHFGGRTGHREIKLKPI